jgi:hypothetical protein
MSKRENISNVVERILFVLLLFSTLLYATELPYLGHNGFLWLLYSFSLALIVLNFDRVKDLVRYHRYVLLSLLCLYIWMWISAYFSGFQDIAIKYSIKYSIYVLVFLAFLFLTHGGKNRFLFYRLTLWFLIILAIFGVIEYIFPELRLFYLIRPISSLMAFPRITSLMQWPNQFGVLISIGMLLALILYNKKIISATKFYFSFFLFIIVISLTASINSWFILLLGIFLACLSRAIKLREVFFIVGLLSFSILFFPVSTKKLEIKDSSIFPLFNFLNKSQESEMTSFLGNGSFEKLGIDLLPKYWDVWDSSCGGNFPKPQITTDAVDGRFSFRINTGKLAVFLNQQIPQEVAQKLCNSYEELGLSAFVKTLSPAVTLGLHLSKNKTIYSEAHPGDGRWHELVLHVKTQECSENNYPRIVMLSVRSPQSEVFFDKVTFTGEGQKEKVPKYNITLRKVTDKQAVKPAHVDDVSVAKSFRGRIRLWQATLKAAINIPFTGIGIQTFQASGIGKKINGIGFLHAHNIILNILIELGIPGLLLSFIFITSLLRKARWSDPLVVIPFIMVFAGQMFACYIHDFTFTTIVFYFLAEAGNSKI